MKVKRQAQITKRGWIIPTQRPDKPLRISPEDRALFAPHNWTATKCGDDKWYAVTRINGVYTYAHQMLGFRGGDHKSGDGMDNRRQNLRPATKSQQTVNTRKRRTHHGVKPTSRFKGVSTNGNGWMVLVGPADTDRYRGTFRTEEEAAEVYNDWAKQLWGPFARLNVIEP